ncbi:eukaryotic translation initiation factor 3 subunit J-B [Electrophorus electricus]|uniref:Eukaryotic translation initiation factor 3 subunit J n=1 Tax=Electrophorus electricus TaxID=8005 RepID=A0A4W4GPL6_ELEEL|nr:eukaryotic translation initiation factor 3 subunit J-B [Electrophorus electricus]
MADSDSWDADNFEPNEPIKTTALQDRWEGEDEEDDVKDNWDDDEEEEPKEEEEEEEKKTEVKPPEKRKMSAKLKEKECEKEPEKLSMRIQESQPSVQLTSEEQAAEKLRLQKLQEESDMALAREAFGVETTATTHSASRIEAMCPSTKDDFVAFEKLLRDKISQFDKSVHYCSFLESLFRELCISLEVDDLRKISNSLSVLLSEKQKQEKEKAKGTKKKKKNVLAGGGLKAKQKDDLDDYGDFDGGYNDYEDFM